ncbi:MAG: hypothetical protein ACI9OJ_001976, partial [Myxococcota bacterium]
MSDRIDPPEVTDETSETKDTNAEHNVGLLMRAGLGQAAPSGPERSRMLARLVASRQATDVDSETTSADKADAPSHPNRGSMRWGWLALAASVAAAIGVMSMSSTPGSEEALVPIVTASAPESPGKLSAGNAQPGESAPPAFNQGSVHVVRVGSPERLVEQVLADGTRLIVNAGGSVVVEGPRHLRVDSGELILDVVKGGGEFLVDLPQGRIVVLGTRFAVNCTAEQSTTTVLQGTVRVENDKGNVTLRQGQEATVTAAEPPLRQPAPSASHRTSWARHLSAVSKSVTPAVRRGGLFARAANWPREYPLPLRSITVDVVVEDQVARTTIDATFFNATHQQLEGVYRLAVPADAALSRLAMYVDGKLMEGGIVERKKGREVYESIVHRRRDPALLEWMEGQQLKVRIFPLPARREKRLIVSFTQPLERTHDVWKLRLPMPVVDGAVGRQKIRVEVRGAQQGLVSSTHDLTVAGRNPMVATWSADSSALSPELIVTAIGAERARHRKATFDGNHYAITRFQLDEVTGGGREALLAAAPRWAPRSWVLLYDTSASRSPAELKAQAFVARESIAQFDDEDEVLIASLDVTARPLSDGFVRATDISTEWLESTLTAANNDAAGHTDLAAGLVYALSELSARNNPHILYLGDGLVTAGEAVPAAVAGTIAGKARFVGAAVAASPNERVLRACAEATGGRFAVMSPGDDLKWRVIDLISSLSVAQVSDLKAEVLDGDGVALAGHAYLSRQSLGLFEEVSVVARAESPVASVRLTGRLGDTPWSHRILLDSAVDEASFLPRAWARRRVESLVTDGAGKHAEELTELGLEHFLVTPTTSLLVLETEAMYRKHRVKRQPTSPWRRYLAPPTIPVRYEPKRATIRKPGAPIYRQPVQWWRSSGRATLGLRGVGGGGLGWTTFGDGSFNFQDRAGIGDSFDAGVTATAAPAFGRTLLTRVAPDRSRGSMSQHSLNDFKSGPSAAEDNDWHTVGNNREAGELGSGYFTEIPLATTGASDGTVTTLDGLLLNGEMNQGLLAGGYPVAFHYAGDPRLSDLTEFVPGLMTSEFERIVEGLVEFADAAKPSEVSAEVYGVIAKANASLVGRALRLGGWTTWFTEGGFVRRQTLSSGLTEVTRFGGSMLSQDYPELGLRTERSAGAAEPVVLERLAPMLVPSARSLSRWYSVGVDADGQLVATGEDERLTWGFDLSGRLASFERSVGADLADRLAFRWTIDGVELTRSGRVVKGHWVEVALDAEPPSTTVVRLPLRPNAEAISAPAGSAPWRSLRVQQMAAAAATSDTARLYRVFKELLMHGIRRGELTLASRMIPLHGQLKERLGFAASAGAEDPVGRYLAARIRLVSSRKRTSIREMSTESGLIGMLAAYSSILTDADRATNAKRRMALARRVRQFVKRVAHRGLRRNVLQRTAERWVWEDLPAFREATADLRVSADGSRFTVLLARGLQRVGKNDEAVVHYKRSFHEAIAARRPVRVDHQFRQAFLGTPAGQMGWNLFVAEQLDTLDSPQHDPWRVVGALSLAWVERQYNGGKPARHIAVRASDVVEPDARIAICNRLAALGRAADALALFDEASGDTA